jgi:hypothetical protein
MELREFGGDVEQTRVRACKFGATFRAAGRIRRGRLPFRFAESWPSRRLDSKKGRFDWCPNGRTATDDTETARMTRISGGQFFRRSKMNLESWMIDTTRTGA